MRNTAERQELEAAAEEIFELTKMSWIARDRMHREKGQIDLTESEFLTLDWLVKSQPKTLTVGDIQKRIGKLPAQMSRIIRSLETKSGKPLIRCQINPRDRRRVDVTLTETGRRAHELFRQAMLASTVDMVSHLPASDRTDLMRILRSIREFVSNKLQNMTLDR